MRNNRKGALPDNRQGSPVLSARQHAAAAQPRPPRTVTYPSAEQAQPPQHLGIHIPHRPDASDHPTDAGHCLTSPPGPYAPTPRRNSPAPFKTLPCRRTTVPPFRRLGTPRRHRATPRRRAPTLQLPDATLPPHSRHTPAAAHRLHTVPTPRTTPLTQEHAPRRALPRLTAGPQCSNSPSQLARLIQGTPRPPHNGSTVPTPRTIPPTPEPATRRALPRLSAGPQRSNSPSQRSRAIQDTPLPPNTDPTSSRHLGPPPTPGHASPPGTAPSLRRAAPTPRRNAPAPFKAHTCRRTPVPTAPTPRTTPPTPGHASPPGPNAPTPRRNAPAPFKTHPCRRTTAPHRPNPRTTPPAQDSTAPPGTKKSGSASRTYSFVSNFSVKNRRLHLAQTNALTQHNQSGAYPLINPCPHN